MTSQSIEYLKVTIILCLLFLTFTENEHEGHEPAQFSSGDRSSLWVICKGAARGKTSFFIMTIAQPAGFFSAPSTQLPKTQSMLGTVLSTTWLLQCIGTEGHLWPWHYTEFSTWVIAVIPHKTFTKDIPVSPFIWLGQWRPDMLGNFLKVT